MLRQVVCAADAGLQGQSAQPEQAEGLSMQCSLCILSPVIADVLHKLQYPALALRRGRG